ncbi:MAG: Fe-S cluster assembly protein SufD [Gaiellaceae bacterium]|jgi:Fe-S cluster assembly protein SufD
MSRAAALERYHELTLPTTSEEGWRFTDLTGFDPDAYELAGEARPAAIAPLFELELFGSARIDEGGVEILGAPAGVVFAPLKQNDKRVGRLVKADDKIAAANAAFWKHGLLVEAPAGVELAQPLYVRIESTVPTGSLPTRLLVVAGENSRFTLIEEHVSAAEDLDALTNCVVEIHLGAGAKLELISVQRLSRESWHFARQHARLDRGSELDWVYTGLGSKKSKTWISNDLTGAGATSRVTGVYFADGSQHLDFDTYQEHAAPRTNSDFLFRGALREQATTVWRGMIRVEPEAQGTDAYQENRNLLLSRQTHANSIPGLEILANDVRCTHGSTVGQVDREQLFYLMSRGLPESEAERLIVSGFFAQALDRIERESVREALARALEARIP